MPTTNQAGVGGVATTSRSAVDDLRCHDNDEEPLVANIDFRGVDYVISLMVSGRNRQLVVDVEDSNTTDHWTGQYDAEYIEELTHKTANYKQFSVFCSMLKSSILKTSDSVGLDLLTFGDLQLLRKRKTTRDDSAQLDVGQGADSLLAKRYLILTYNVEFDRIHYPLPLEYKGKPKPMELRQTIRELNKKVLYMEKQASSDFKVDQSSDSHFQQQLTEVISDRNRLEKEFTEYRHMHNAFVSTNNVKNGSNNQNSEVRQLKSIIGKLEKELALSDNKQNKMGAKRADKYNRLADEVEELRISKRGCMNRIKNLTHEIEECKRKLSRNGVMRPLRSQRSSSRESYYDQASCSSSRYSGAASSSSANRRPQRSNSSNGGGGGRRHEARGDGGEPRRYQRECRPQYKQEYQQQYEEHRRRSRTRPEARQHHRNSAGDRRRSNSRHESPSGSLPRFDPTAYIQEKKRLQSSKENDRRIRERRNRTLGSSRNSGRGSKTPSVCGSLASSVCSLSEINSETDLPFNNSKSSARRSRPAQRNSSRRKNTNYSSADSMDYNKLKSDRLSSTPDRNKARQRNNNNNNSKNNINNNNSRSYRNQNQPKTSKVNKDKESLNDFIDNSHEMEERLSRIQKFLDEAQS